jgi:MYXO-CTERM domain-containing protein
LHSRSRSRRRASPTARATTTGPALEERSLHYFTDQFRVDPNSAGDEYGELTPVPPLVYNADLNAAARFYAEDMEANGCFPADHSSCDGTSFADRLSSFYSGASFGENIAQGYFDPYETVFQGWFHSEGHRVNMLRINFDEMGTGFAGTVDTNSTWWVQDFGGVGGLAIPIVPSATHDPLYPDSASPVSYLAMVHDDLGDPSKVEVMVGGLCHEMDPDFGEPGSRTWSASSQSGSAGCLEYVITVTRIDGEVATYPTEGSLVVPVGGADCPIWTENRTQSECTPGAGSGLGGQGIGCGAEGGDPDDNVGDDAQYGSCAVAAPPGPRGFGGLLVLALGGVALRRRRS